FEMVFERRQERKEKTSQAAITVDHLHNIAVFPLALPLIATRGHFRDGTSRRHPGRPVGPPSADRRSGAGEGCGRGGAYDRRQAPTHTPSHSAITAAHLHTTAWFPLALPLTATRSHFRDGTSRRHPGRPMGPPSADRRSGADDGCGTGGPSDRRKAGPLPGSD